ncbi:MAG TPA: hypothetical protein VJP40_07175 [bacterium]|nr:hypothetical protein [bacterium]
MPKNPSFLSEAEIEARIVNLPELAFFRSNPSPLVIFRSRPSREDPIFEIQLAFDLGDRLETYQWLWIDALEGRILRKIPEYP